MLIARDSWLVVMLVPLRSALLNNLPEECRLLVASGEHDRNGIGQIRRVRGCCHSALNHDWISYIFFDYIKIIMTATNIRIMEEITENQLFEHDLEASVCAQPVRPVQPTGQTGLHGSAWA